ncbi:2Fe-2S iron-sulfur cluster-binding protein [Streptomyces albus]
MSPRLLRPDDDAAGRRPDRPLRLTVDGEPVTGVAGQTLAGVLLAAGRLSWRQGPAGAPRGVFCGIGACFDCLLTVNGERDVRACRRRAADGDTITTQSRTAAPGTQEPPGTTGPARTDGPATGPGAGSDAGPDAAGAAPTAPYSSPPGPGSTSGPPPATGPRPASGSGPTTEPHPTTGSSPTTGPRPTNGSPSAAGPRPTTEPPPTSGPLPNRPRPTDCPGTPPGSGLSGMWPATAEEGR